jgi:hypothetical protein
METDTDSEGWAKSRKKGGGSGCYALVGSALKVLELARLIACIYPSTGIFEIFLLFYFILFYF